MLVEASKCLWDGKTHNLTTADEVKWEKEVKAFKSAFWFKDKFGLLAKASGKEKDSWPPRPFIIWRGQDPSKPSAAAMRNLKKSARARINRKQKKPKTRVPITRKRKRRKMK
jgi:hypothetical protein